MFFYKWICLFWRTDQLEQNDSLFTYGSDGKTFTDFQKTDYVPEDFTSVIQDLIGQKQNESEAVRSCDGIQECLYDYLASGEDINKGVAAITADVRRKADRRKIGERRDRDFSKIYSLTDVYKLE